MSVLPRFMSLPVAVIVATVENNAKESWPELDAARGDPRFAALRRRVFGDFETGAER